MIDRRRTGHVVITLAAGEGRPHPPAHLDVLAGAARPVSHLDAGRLDRTLRDAGGAFRATAVFHARRSFAQIGGRTGGYDDIEERLGLSRTYRLELADPSEAETAVRRVRELATVEGASLELLATVPMAVAAAPPVTREQITAPHATVRGGEALALEPGDERVTVAVVDTGVSLGHPEFQRKLLSGYDAVELGLGRVSSDLTLVGDSHGRDFSPFDDVGHGSHVAGIIGAQGWQVPRGTAGRSLLLPIRVLAAARAEGQAVVTGVGSLCDIDAGLKVALDLGADVVNMSFGTPASAVDPAAPLPHESIIRYGAQRGCVLVAAMGNSGVNEPFYPAAFEQVIAVGSVADDGSRSAFSTYGSHVALCAPGENVVGVGRRGYRSSSGTSHAAPFVAGAAALLIARARRGGRHLPPTAVADLLTGTARPSASPAVETGAGVLDIPAALQAFDGRFGNPTPDTQENVSHD